MAYQAAMAGAGALKTLNPSSCGISLNIFADKSYEILIRHLMTATEALSSRIPGIIPLYLVYRIIELIKG
jgi:hypothetical protein